MHTLNNIQALIIDMDGVLWKGEQPLPGLKTFFKLIRANHLRFILATNNATLTQQQYIDKLKKMGVSVFPEEILTSSMATASHLAELTQPETTTLYTIGEQGLRQPLLDKGFILTDHFSSKSNAADFVVSGLDRKLTWDKLTDAALHIQAGAQFFATNGDSSLPTERGDVVGNGAILAALKATTGISPTVIGKPEAIMYQQAIKQLNVAPEDTIAIGDRLNTDILGAVNTGIRSLFVLTGISSREDLAETDYQPTWIMDDLHAITDALRLSFKNNSHAPTIH